MSISPLGSPELALLSPHVDGGTPIAPALPQLDSDPGKLESTSPFQEMFQKAIGNTNHTLQTAQQAATDFATGQSDDIHGTMLAVSEADIQLRLVGTMRNKIVDAFYELWRLQV